MGSNRWGHVRSASSGEDLQSTEGGNTPRRAPRLPWGVGSRPFVRQGFANFFSRYVGIRMGCACGTAVGGPRNGGSVRGTGPRTARVAATLPGTKRSELRRDDVSIEVQ